MSDLQALSSQEPGPVITETSPGEANTATLRPEDGEARRESSAAQPSHLHLQAVVEDENTCR